MANPVKLEIVDENTIFVVYDDGIEGEYSLEKTGLNTKGKVYIDDTSKDIKIGNNEICKNALYKQLYMKSLMKRLKIDLDKI